MSKKDLELDIECLKSENRNLVYTVEKLIQELSMLQEKACLKEDSKFRQLDQRIFELEVFSEN
jgi:hypothetical protein